MLETVKNMLKAHYPIIFLQSFEWFRITDLLRQQVKTMGYQVSEWNFAEGLMRGKDFVEDTEGVPVPLMRELFRIAKSADENQEKEIFLLVDFAEYLCNPEIRTILRLLSHELKYTNKHIILLGSVSDIPIELEKEITLLEFPLPEKAEIKRALRVLLEEINQSMNPPVALDVELEDRLTSAAQGLTIHEADLAFSRAIIECKGLNEQAIKIVVQEKEQIIKKSRILEYFHTNQSFQDVGGLQNLKNWLQMRTLAFTEKAREFGLPQPKGILLTGVPGCGKSLTAKAVASMWNMPLLRLDVGKVFEGIVGSSEHNIRKAIMTAESIAPCILWLDEIEKGLAGIQSSGSTDSGTTARVFATLLNWMQEKTKAVFMVATANNLDSLPPELLRKGRFDEIFFVDLPTQKERQDIFKIHVERLKMNLTQAEYTHLSQQTIGFNGAEIEACIKEAMFLAYQRLLADGESQLTQNDILQKIGKTIPLSATRKLEIDKMREVAKVRFVLASQENAEEIPQNSRVLLTQAEEQYAPRKRNLDI